MIGQCRATINKHILISGSSVCAYSFIIGTYSVLVINIPTSFHITSTLYQRQDREENKQVHACSELWSVARFSLAHEEAGGPGERKRQGRRHVTGDATARGFASSLTAASHAAAAATLPIAPPTSYLYVGLE